MLPATAMVVDLAWYVAASSTSAVDSVLHSPYADSMDLHVPPELEAKLNRLAAGTGRDAEQVALDLLTNSVEHDEWFRREVEQGRVSAREGRLLNREELLARIDKRYGA